MMRIELAMENFSTNKYPANGQYLIRYTDTWLQEDKLIAAQCEFGRFLIDGIYDEKKQKFIKAFCRHPADIIKPEQQIEPTRANRPQSESGATVNAQIMAEVAAAIEKFPTWQTDPIHAVNILGEEFGELMKAVLQCVYEPHKSTKNDVKKEAIQTAAMAIRFLQSLEKYQYSPSEQHIQEGFQISQAVANEQ